MAHILAPSRSCPSAHAAAPTLAQLVALSSRALVKWPPIQCGPHVYSIGSDQAVRFAAKVEPVNALMTPTPPTPGPFVTLDLSQATPILKPPQRYEPNRRSPR